MILTVYGRFFKIYLYTALSPVALASFAGEPTQNIGRSFIKGYSAVCLEGVIIMLSCVIFSLFASSPPVIDTNAAAVNMVWKYIGELIFNMLVLVGTVKISDRLVREMLGIQDVKLKVTIEEIEEDLCDLDTEYREALAKGLVDMKYLSDTPLSLKYGTDIQQQELKRVYSKPLSGKQLKDIINYISKDMQGDYQYGRYKGIASMYLNIADQIIAGKNKGREAR